MLIKKIKVLSGGEKARVALAKTIVSQANFLMLDEPTNHLDMHSCELLIEALNKYEGSFILVSHDRYFISKTANKNWEIDDHKIREFKGPYEEWVDWKERNEATNAQFAIDNNKKNNNNNNTPKAAPAAQPVNSQPSTVNNSSNSPINKEQKKELQKQQRNFQQLEEKIALLTKQKNELEASLTDPSIYSDKNKFAQAESNYKKAAAELIPLNKQYEDLFEKIVSLESSL